MGLIKGLSMIDLLKRVGRYTLCMCVVYPSAFGYASTITLADLQKEITLQKLLSYTETHHPKLKSMYAQWNAFKEKAPQEARLPDPKVTYGYFIQPTQTKVGPQEQMIGVLGLGGSGQDLNCGGEGGGERFGVSSK